MSALKGIPALLAAAVLCALASNALAPAHRRLDWAGWVPPADAHSGPASPAPTVTAPPALEAKREAAPPVPAPGVPRPAVAAAHPAVQVPRWLPAKDAPTREITSDEAWAAFQQRIPFLDARRSEDFAAGHIKGAVSAPVWEAGLEGRLTAFEAAVVPAPEAPLVLYCSGGDCEDSHLLARRLVTLGYRNLLIYRDGFPDWVAKGRPAHPGQR